MCGKGTWYVGPTDYCRDGTKYEPSGQWCAVDEQRFGRLRERNVLVYSDNAFAVWPVRDSHRGGDIIDAPKDTHEQARGTLDTQHVCVWEVGRKIRQERRMELWRTW